MNEPSEERVTAAATRTIELVGRFEAAIREHFTSHPEADPSDLGCDTIAAAVYLLADLVKLTGADRLGLLKSVADQLGVETITSNSKSVGHG